MLSVRHKKAPNAISGRPAGLCRGKLRLPGKLCQREPRRECPSREGPHVADPIQFTTAIPEPTQNSSHTPNPGPDHGRRHAVPPHRLNGRACMLRAYFKSRPQCRNPPVAPPTEPRPCRSAWTVEFRLSKPQTGSMAERVLKPVVSFSRGFAEADARQRAFWHSRTPEERWWHLEYLRELNYGPAPTSARLPRIPRVSQRRWG